MPSNNMPSNYEKISEDESEVTKILVRDFMPLLQKGFIRYGPEKVVVPEYYLAFSEAIEKFEVRSEDICVLSHPKTGTTWTQEMVWCIANDLDYKGAEQTLAERFPCLELSALFDYRELLAIMPDIPLPLFVKDSVQYVAEQKSPRFIKSHLPWQMLPCQVRDNEEKPKIVYVARNAKDTCLSYYHYCKLLGGFNGDMEDFAKLFLAETMNYSPFWAHVLSFWERRDEPNILFLKFEDMKNDLPSVIHKTATFLGKTITDSQVDTLAEHLSFQNMKENPALNHAEEMLMNFQEANSEGSFMRKGEVGQWKVEMNDDLIEKFDKWTLKHTEGTGLTL